ncbi:zinc-binding dehydrogenase [Marinobacter salarius]|uniref:zinc-binding dehydrogenase n=1 Tax=Marinobacter salarius TaxID=1420917 RepID=UPI00273C41B3|nr:zinc-binding dehydrogenase [Marinobacter salarius]MDP4532896.1 zinc-binding dehydrogenase [Marinobacter salarius]
MKAVVIVKKEGQETPDLEYIEVPDPVQESNELLVKVKSVGVNRIDLRRSTAHGAPSEGKPLIAGLEMAGEVVAVGDKTSGFAVGDRVMGMTTGAYAEFATIDYRFALKVPRSFSYDQACAIATVYPTAHNALVTNGGFTAGKSVLIQGVGAAVGIASLQIAKALGASIVIGTGISEGVAPRLKELGLDVFVKADKGSIVQDVLNATSGKGADIVIDMVGGPAIDDNINTAALGGTIVNVGWVGSTTGEIDLDNLARKRLKLIGVSFRTRSAEQKEELYRVYQNDVYPFYEDGTITPVIYKNYPLKDAAKAQGDMSKDAHFGKFILNP